MGLKIRLRKQGRINRPFYRLVLAESRTKRDGKYLEMLGWYNPLQPGEEENFFIKADRVDYWLSNGAELSDNARALVAKSAPEIMKKITQKSTARKTRQAAKRRARRKATTTA